MKKQTFSFRIIIVFHDSCNPNCCFKDLFGQEMILENPFHMKNYEQHEGKILQTLKMVDLPKVYKYLWL